MSLMYPRPTKARSRAVLDFARGQECTIRIPGAGPHDRETVVACHLPGHGKGTGSKVSDIHIAFGCFECHAICDGRLKPPPGVTPAIILDAMLRGLSETQDILVAVGVITIKGYNDV
jgi:hypothetical protein